MKRKIVWLSVLVLGLTCIQIASLIGRPLGQSAAYGQNAFTLQRNRAHEVWLVDQSDTRPDGGGLLYIYQGADLSGPNASQAPPEIIDLGGSARDVSLAQTGSAQRRPHMLWFNPSHTHGILSFVATGHVVFIEAATRRVVASIDVGAQAHAALPTPDQRYVLVANQNGKLFQRIRTDYRNNTFTLENAATLNLATCTAPSGAPCESAALRPDNAPICPLIDAGSRLAFVTLRGGGMFVVDVTATPMRIVAEYDRTRVHGNGCGGIEAFGKMYIQSGGGTPANPLEADLYSFPLSGFSTNPNPPNTPAPRLVFSHDHRGHVDSHGSVLIPGGRRAFGGPYLWAGDRAQNLIVVVDPRRDIVVNEFSLSGPAGGDPAPDVYDIAPSGDRVYASLRGPNPLSGNVPDEHNAEGTTPGLGIIRVEQLGRTGVLEAIVRITNVINGVERADAHAIRVRLK